MNIIGKIDKMPIVSLASLRLLKTNVSLQTLSNEILYDCKKGKLINLKRWRYVTTKFLENKPSYYEYYLANQLYQPSYISWVTALSYYSMFSESVFGFTSISINKTSILRNALWTFFYSNIKEELFTWYRQISTDSYSVFIATKAKALFDYFWYIKHKFITLSIDDLENLRLNFDEFTKKDFREFEKYCILSKSKKMIRFGEVINDFLLINMW